MQNDAVNRDDLRREQLSAAQRWRREGNDLQEVVIRLRGNACSMIDCILIISELTGWSKHEAKDYVHKSRAWQDMREVHDRFHDQIQQVEQGD